METTSTPRPRCGWDSCPRSSTGDPVAAAQERARRMLRRAPLSFGAAKRLAQLAADADLRSGMLAESLAQTALLGSEDHREGLAAAREKRDAGVRGALIGSVTTDV